MMSSTLLVLFIAGCNSVKQTANESSNSEILSSIPINENAVVLGLANVVNNTGLLGRYQTVQFNPKIINPILDIRIIIDAFLFLIFIHFVF